jgi:uncharacterized protein (TIGR03067 family)
MTVRVASVAVVLAFLCGPIGRGQEKKDADSILGKWQFVSVHDGGRLQNEDDTKNSTLTITKDKMTIHTKRDGKEKEMPVEYKTDPSKSPKWIDITNEKGDKMKGIYELKDDTLRLCFNERSSGERANAFESKANSSNDVLIVLKRAK